jgi:hypothetical protein
MKNTFFLFFFLPLCAFAQLPVPIDGQEPAVGDEDWIEIPVEDLPGYQKPDKNKLSRSKRIGAKCKDGSFSKTVGTGACAGHGGVLAWVYRDTITGEKFEEIKGKNSSRRKREKISSDESNDDIRHQRGDFVSFWNQPFGIFIQFALAVMALLVIVILIRKIV